MQQQVPEYVICLDEWLLDRGIVKCWNRDTTISVCRSLSLPPSLTLTPFHPPSTQELMHCSRIVDYILRYAKAVTRRSRAEAEDAQ